MSHTFESAFAYFAIYASFNFIAFVNVVSYLFNQWCSYQTNVLKTSMKVIMDRHNGYWWTKLSIYRRQSTTMSNAGTLGPTWNTLWSQSLYRFLKGRTYTCLSKLLFSGPVVSKHFVRHLKWGHSTPTPIRSPTSLTQRKMQHYYILFANSNIVLLQKVNARFFIMHAQVRTKFLR